MDSQQATRRTTTPSVRRRRVAVALAVALVASAVTVSGALPAEGHNTGYYQFSGTSQEEVGHAPEWMADLPDDLRLSEMSIPGTHDSPAIWAKRHDNLFVPTQTMSLGNQLESGIRHLDIRVRHFNNTFTLHHGAFFLHQGFEDALEPVVEFLNDHPSETVYLQVAGTHKDAWSGNTRSVEETLSDYLDNCVPAHLVPEHLDGQGPTCTRYWDYLWDPLLKRVKDPQLGDTRGRIVLLDRLTSDGWGAWTRLTDPDDPDGEAVARAFAVGQFCSQDMWENGGVEKFMATKWLKILGQFQRAQDNIECNKENDHLFANWLTGSAAGYPPYFVASGHTGPATGDRLKTRWMTSDCHISNYCIDAYPRLDCIGDWCHVYYEGMNVLAGKWIESARDDGYLDRTGFVVADFPGADLINAIISINPRPPTVKLDDGGDGYHAQEGIKKLLQVEASDPNDDPLEYWWDFDGDGTDDVGPLNDPLVLHTWPDDFEGEVRVTVSDGRFKVSDSTTIVVDNWVPFLGISGKDTVTEGAAYTLSGTIVDPGVKDTFTVTIDWGPEIRVYEYRAGTETFTEEFTYPDDEPDDDLGGAAVDAQQVSVVVEDKDGGTSKVRTKSVDVSNVVPWLSSFEGDNIWENQSATVVGRFQDPGVGEEFTVTIDWAGTELEYQLTDEEASQRKFERTFHFPDDNPTNTLSDDYAIAATIVDDDQGHEDISAKQRDQATVTVANRVPKPTIAHLLDETGMEVGTEFDRPLLLGLEVVLTGRFTDPGPEDTHEAMIDWWEGDPWDELGAVAPTTPIQDTHTVQVPGLHKFTLLVKDDDRGYDTAVQPTEVVDAATALTLVIEDLITLRDAASQDEAEALTDALADLRGRKDGAAGGGATDLLASDDLNAAVGKVAKAIDDLLQAEAVANADHSATTSLLAMASKSLTVQTIAAAEESAHTTDEEALVEDARQFVAEGDVVLIGGDYDTATHRYRAAIRRVEELAG